MVRSSNRAGPEAVAGRKDTEHHGPRKIRAEGKLVLTPALRRRLKRPLGVVYSGDSLSGGELFELTRNTPLLITVGDRVTDFAYSVGRVPDVQIVDRVERRVARKAPEVPFLVLLKARNPAGTITSEAIRAIGRAMSGRKPARVLIDGEEDLLAIPAVKEAPVGSILLYGQPGVGVVLVAVDTRAKVAAERTMLAMAG